MRVAFSSLSGLFCGFNRSLLRVPGAGQQPWFVYRVYASRFGSRCAAQLQVVFAGLFLECKS